MILFMFIFSFLFILVIFFTQPKQKSAENNQTEQTTDNIAVNDEKKENLKQKDFYGKYQIIDKEVENNDSLLYENDNIKIEFDKKDAVIKHAWVKDTFLNKNRGNVLLYDLVDPVLGLGSLWLKLGSWENEATLANITGGDNQYNFKREGNDFIFTCKLKKKEDDTVYTIQKIYKFIDNENLFKLDIKINNNKNLPTDFDNSGIAYSIGWGPSLGINSREEKPNKSLKDVFSYFNGKDLVKVDSRGEEILINSGNFFGIGTKKVKKLFTIWNKEGDDSWISSNGHYFVAIMYPDNKNYKYFFDYRGSKNSKIYYCGFARASDVSHVDSSFYIYIGPKIGSILKRYNNFNKGDFNIKNSNISKINEKIVYGLGNAIGWLLEKIYLVVKNYGLAIIILTIIIKIILFPLTQSSMKSQQKMSKLQPKIKELQEKYKDKPELLNRETMNLYKKEKINPLGGCLPMLLQMPILFSMYYFLNQMVALKGASFLWIKDLSAPDAVFNFGFTVPILNMSSLNILPIIMVLTQVLSSLLMPDLKTNKQAQLMVWGMPIFFFFIFYNVSSGLVLYWTVMNILNLAQQMVLNYSQRKNMNIAKA